MNPTNDHEKDTEMTTKPSETKQTTPTAPARGEFCHRHFSWLCQAGQGKCQEAKPRTQP